MLRQMHPAKRCGKRDYKEEQFALDEVLQLVAARAVSITGADGVAIALAHDDAIVCRASFGRIAPDPGVKLDPEAGFSELCRLSFRMLHNTSLKFVTRLF